jgi:hypothetical protein
LLTEAVAEGRLQMSEKQSARLFVSEEAREGTLALLQKRRRELGRRSQPLRCGGLIDGLLRR